MSDFNEPTTWSWIYFLTISVFTVVGGAVNCSYGVNNLQQKIEFTGLSGLFGIFSGCAMILLVAIWTVAATYFKYYAVKFRKILHEIDSHREENNNNISERAVKIPQNAIWAKKKAKEMTIQRRKMMKLRFLILFSMIFAFLCETVSTGIFWHTKTKLDSKFIVTENCFCSLDKDYQNNYHMLRTDCPFQYDHSLLYCLSVFEPEKIVLQRHTSFTLTCQRLSGEGESDPLCMEYLVFWAWFKVLRVLLPLLATIKLPMIVINMIVTVIKPPPQNANDSDSFSNATWLHLDTLVGGNKIDPIKYYENMCAPLQFVPPVGERLGPYGQEKEDEMFISIKTWRRKPGNTKSGHLKPPGELEFSKAPTQLLPLNVVKCSPPDKENNTFSTPLVNKRNSISPNFNLSRLAPDQSSKVGSFQQNNNFTAEKSRRSHSFNSAYDTTMKFSTFRNFGNKLAETPNCHQPGIEVKITRCHSDPSSLESSRSSSRASTKLDITPHLVTATETKLKKVDTPRIPVQDIQNNSNVTYHQTDHSVLEPPVRNLSNDELTIEHHSTAEITYEAPHDHHGTAEKSYEAPHEPHGTEEIIYEAPHEHHGTAETIYEVPNEHHETNFEFPPPPTPLRGCDSSSLKSPMPQALSNPGDETPDAELIDPKMRLQVNTDSHPDRTECENEAPELNLSVRDKRAKLEKMFHNNHSIFSSAPDLNNNGKWVSGESNKLDRTNQKIGMDTFTRPQSLLNMSQVEKPMILSKKPTGILASASKQAMQNQ